MQLLLPALLLAPLSLAAAVSSSSNSGGLEARQDSTCAEVHLFLARGDGEGYPGRIGAIDSTVCGGLPSCDYENIGFTSVDGSVYCDSVAEGANNGIGQIYAYNQRCPEAKLVLGGYSLGAHVVGDILGGGGGDFYNCFENGVAGLNPDVAPGNKIVAAVLFGDVRHVAGQSYNVGSGSGEEGEYPRSGDQLANLNRFASRLQNYCLWTDPICALGDDGLSHTTYMQVYAGTAGDWIRSMVNQPVAPAAPPPPLPTTSHSVAPPPPTPTPSPPTTSKAVTTPPAIVKVPTSSSSLPPTTSSSSLTSSSTTSSTSYSTLPSSAISSRLNSATQINLFSLDSNTSTAITSAPPSTTTTPAAQSTASTSTSKGAAVAARATGSASGAYVKMVGLVVVGALAW